MGEGGVDEGTDELGFKVLHFGVVLLRVDLGVVQTIVDDKLGEEVAGLLIVVAAAKIVHLGVNLVLVDGIEEDQVDDDGKDDDIEGYQERSNEGFGLLLL